MKKRCKNPSSEFFANYGGRGITVDPRWEDFQNFYTDMGPKPGEGYSLDRIDNNGPYSKENCRWATAEQQANNKTNSRLFTYNGITQTLPQWARAIGKEFKLLRGRIDRNWPIELALTAPLNARLNTFLKQEQKELS